MTSSPCTADDVIAFWQNAGPERWFRKDTAFDDEFRARFLPAHEAAAAGSLDDWAATAPGALALLILLDQFPRNAFRGTARMFATDAQARAIANTAIANGFDQAVEPALRPFVYLPFMHSELLVDQHRSVALNERLDADTLKFARLHLDIIERFGRFPHRNDVLGRYSTRAEQHFLAEGGFAG
ncbi:DUF924 family protein [Rhizobacter sp. Root1221]|uniref:DUF924 family protein n=1 Tax=Rhizobacter sp. Root1221 TaxID=1736433 RepID=UPI0006F66835|nr:DUF924 family protein [Rhizobacter sp. Root1221]KQV98462.1 hypothetical protein ASC87_21585 [Rhizobacter sp. Root1221]